MNWIHNLRYLQVNIIDKYTGVDFDPTPLSAHKIFRPTKGYDVRSNFLSAVNHFRLPPRSKFVGRSGRAV